MSDFVALWPALVLGFFGSFHCIGMCGPIALALPVQRHALPRFVFGRILYNLGRVVTYALLGLAIGKRLLELHGGDVFVSSPDAGLCRYRIEIAAQPAARALWIDPLQPGREFGPVHAGRVLFVGRSERVPARCRGALERAGYHVEQVACEEQVLARIEGDVQRWSAIVLDPTCRQETLFAFVDAVRATGYRALMFLLVEDGTESSRFVAGVDQVLHAPDGSRLLAALRRLRATTNAGTPPVRACPPG